MIFLVLFVISNFCDKTKNNFIYLYIFIFIPFFGELS